MADEEEAKKKAEAEAEAKRLADEEAKDKAAAGKREKEARLVLEARVTVLYQNEERDIMIMEAPKYVSRGTRSVKVVHVAFADKEDVPCVVEREVGARGE